MKQIVTGIVAHVDAGKTTLTEALMYETGAIRKLGRVDNGNAFLDPDTLEKQRGITLFTHQAELTYNDLILTLLDTPGHVDFASQTEQALPALDYAILVISATDGIQGYTRTLWELLKRYNVPTFIFINKADVIGADPKGVIKQLQQEFSAACLEFSDPLTDEVRETIAMQDDEILTNYLETDELTVATIQQLIKQRKVFPVYVGAALKLTGIKELLAGFEYWTIPTNYSDQFSARIFKVSHDQKGERLAWIKVTGGQLPAKMTLNDEKADQIRIYNGEKYTIQSVLTAGQVGAITGLTKAYPGEGLGNAPDLPAPQIQPVLSYAVIPQKDQEIHACLTALRQLEDEDPLLHVNWSSELNQLSIQVMGELQLEIIKQLLTDRYNLKIEFDHGNILYQETITQPVEGVGHFEPLRHYAEVHLRIEPAALGSGLHFASECSEDILDRNYQHQVLTSLQAKTHRGVLTGMPITDMRITLVNGRAHIKHTEGGDFRQATWRALRQGLMMLKQANAIQLLEPWYQFRLTVPSEQVGHAINDIQQMAGTFKIMDDSTISNGLSILTGQAPVATMRGYVQAVRTYTHGQGHLELMVAGYQPCHNATEIIANLNYDPVADLDNTPDSVFCAHGAGYPVSWKQVPQMAHLPYQKTNNV